LAPPGEREVKAARMDGQGAGARKGKAQMKEQKTPEVRSAVDDGAATGLLTLHSGTEYRFDNRSTAEIIAELELVTRPFVQVRVEAGSDLGWSVLSRAPEESLEAALAMLGSDTSAKSNLHVVAPDFDPSSWPALAAEIAASPAQLVAVELRCDGRIRNDLERALFGAGFRKHPAYYLMNDFVALTDRNVVVRGLYERIDADLTRDFTIDRLLETRDLHMDMSREAGLRSDAHIIRYRWAAGQIDQGARILDACSGLGYGSDLLHRLCDARVTGVDIDADAVAYAESLYGRPGRVQFVASDVLAYLGKQPDASFDAVVMFEGLEHVEAADAILAEIARVLDPAGRYYCSVPAQWVDETGTDPNPYHVRVYDWDVLRATLSKDFALSDCLGQTGGRINEDGTWVKKPAGMVVYAPEEPLPAKPEWWLAVGVPRARIGTRPSLDAPPSYEVHELMRRVADPRVKVVSFDIFDTLLSRPLLAPQDLFEMLQVRHFASRGRLYENFAAVRQRAEKTVRDQMRANGIGDITLAEIYTCLGDYLGLSQDESDQLREAELALESRLLYPRGAIRKVFDAARDAGKRIIVASDMYLDPDFLMTVLRNEGFEGIDRLYVSSAYREQKRTGLLYQRIIADLRQDGFQAGDVLHIGDNRHSDILQAEQAGFASGYIARLDELPKKPQPAVLASPPQSDIGIRLFRGAQYNAVFDDPWCEFEAGTQFNRDPYLYGRLFLSPFVFFAALDLVRELRKAGIRRAYFATRDGHVMRPIVELVARELGQDLVCSDLEISRSVTDLLGIDGPEAAVRMLAAAVAAGKSVTLRDQIQNLLGSALDFRVAPELAAEWRDLSILDQTVTWANLPQAQQTLRALWPEVSPRIARRRANARTYLDGQVPSEAAAIWDCGYYHTSAAMLKQAGWPIGLSSHLVEIGHHESRVAIPHEFPTHSFLGRFNNVQERGRFDTRLHSVLIELLLSDPVCGTRRHYTADGQAVVAAEGPAIRDRNNKALTDIHQGVIDGIDCVLERFGTSILDYQVNPLRIMHIAFEIDVIRELAGVAPLVFDNDGHLDLTALCEKFP
jgi:SAM-dependent methyltransferase/FMN phosphatase YigB (HAD superfamily)